MSRPSAQRGSRILARSDVLAALSLLETRGVVAAGDLRQLRAIAERLDPTSHRLALTGVLSQLYPGATPEQAQTSLRNLRSRLKTSQDPPQLTLELKRSAARDERIAWFTGMPAETAHARTNELPGQTRPRFAGERPAPPLLQNLAIDPDELRPVLLLTVNARETDALYDVFSPGVPLQLFDHSDYPYARFEDAVSHDQRRRRVIAFRCQMGALRSGAANERVTKAIQHFKPAVVLAVGVGFGRKDKQQFGDVLIAQQVTTYESARVNRDGGLAHRSESVPAASAWLERSTQVALPGIHRRTGLVLCGEKLVDNAEFRERLQHDFPLAIGGDMESFGVAMACMSADEQLRVGWMMIKGVSDWGDGDKAGVGDAQGDADQYQAAYRAAMVAYSAIHLLAPVVVEPTEACRQWLQRQPSGLPGERPVDWVEVGRADVERADVDQSPRRKPRTGKPRAKTSDYDTTRATHMVENRTAPASQRPEPLPEDMFTTQARPQAATAQTDAPSVQPVQTTLMQWLQADDAPPVFALLGEYGMGKTVNCQCLYKTLNDARESADAPAWQRLPVYFDLRELGLLKGQKKDGVSPLPTVDAMVDDLFARSWDVPAGQARPDHAELRQWLAEGALLIVDGLDECLVHLGENQHDNFLQSWLNLLESATKAATHAATGPLPRLLLSCRTNFFKRLDDQRNLFVGQQRGYRGADWYVSRLLLPFTDDQIRSYLAQVVPEQPVDDLLALIGDVHNLRELAERPMTLKFLAEYIPKLEEARKRGATVNGAYLYGLVADHWLMRDAGKHHLQPEHKQRLMPALAAHLWRSGVRSLPYDQLHTWFHEWRETQPDLAKRYAAYDQEKLEEDLRTSTFVVREDAESREAGNETRVEGFRFAHSSLAEYFLAVYLADAVRDDRVEDWAMPIPSTETLDFLVQKLVLEQAALPEPRQRDGGLVATLNRWRKTYRAQASELLLRYALHARGFAAEGSQARHASLPGALLPALAGFDLRNAQLRGWRFGERFSDTGAPLLDMAAVQWAGADLRETDFAHVRLDDGDFSGARLDVAAFQHCSAQRGDWSGSDLLGTVFRHCRLDGSQWQPLHQCHRPKVVACSGAEALTDAIRPPQTPVGGPSGPSPSGPAAPISTATLATLPPKLRAAIASQGGAVRSVALSADGGRVVSGGFDGTVRVWDAASGECVRELRGHTSFVLSIALSADGGRVVSGGFDGTVRCFSGAGGRGAATAADLRCAWVAAVGSPSGVPSYASWRPAVVGGPSGPSISATADHAELGAEAPPAQAGDVLISASGDAWRFLSWDVADPADPSGWRRAPLQGYE